MTKLNKWIERITNRPNYENMEKQMMTVIQHAPEKYYLAMFIKHHLPHVNNKNVEQLYSYLASPHNCAIYFPSTIQQIMMDCKNNPSVLELVRLFIDTFHY